MQIFSLAHLAALLTAVSAMPTGPFDNGNTALTEKRDKAPNVILGYKRSEEHPAVILGYKRDPDVDEDAAHVHVVAPEDANGSRALCTGIVRDIEN